jgi:hypothetical protein
LENKRHEYRAYQAITALRQAIEQAEKQFNPDWDQQAVLVKRIRELEAQQALDKKADNARELGLDYEPTHTDHPMRHWDRTCPACVAEAEKQEPVAWSVTWNNDSQKHQVTFNTQDEAMLWSARNLKIGVIKPLYTTPPRKEWVGLTEDDIVDLYCQVGDETEWAIGGLKDAMPFANLVEAKLKEKNNG